MVVITHFGYTDLTLKLNIIIIITYRMIIHEDICGIQLIQNTARSWGMCSCYYALTYYYHQGFFKKYCHLRKFIYILLHTFIHSLRTLTSPDTRLLTLMFKTFSKPKHVLRCSKIGISFDQLHCYTVLIMHFHDCVILQQMSNFIYRINNIYQ